MTAYSFTSSLDLPDGRHIYVSIEIPEDHPAAESPTDLAEHTEIAQISAAWALRNMTRADLARLRDAAEIAETPKAPF